MSKNTKRRGIVGTSMTNHFLLPPSQKTLESMCPVAKFLGKTYDDRVKHMVKAAIKVRALRQATSEVIEYPFGLFDINRKRIHNKTVHMTEHQASIRNKDIKDVGMCWCRIGY